MNHEVRELFHELVERSKREREHVYKDRRIATEVRAEVESLLSFDSTKFDQLRDLVSNAASDVLRSVDVLQSSHCGPYRLVRLLGSGGMGAVYLAERSDGEIQQKVAVKLLRADGHSVEWRDRFLRERELHASMNHPSIVHVIDAGHTDDGRPYLVMEYVEGVPIDVYAAGIDVRDRLKLFVQMCEGVSHAHRHLIIHRDLKPSNILVASSGRPKLLDFGIARLLDESEDATQTMERLLTPNYASPEQLAGSAQTTATDIYSLGAVLYKLLVGVAPRESWKGAPNGEITAPSQINPDVPSDVDYIVWKALRAEPEERYLSVDEFAEDIRSALGWRPVKARAGDTWYHARRYLRRYWMPVAAGLVVLASLSAGLYIANRERALAERRFMDVRQLASKFFDIDAQVSQLPGSSKTRQLIVDTSLEYMRRVTAGIEIDPELALELGTAYMRVARVQGVNISANLGQTDQADQTEQKAQAFIDSVLAAQPTNRAALLRSIQIAHDRMTLAGDAHREEEALRFARRSQEQLEKYIRTGNLGGKSERMDAQQVVIACINAGNRFRQAHHFEEGLLTCRRAIDIAHATDWPHQAAAVMMVVAMIHRETGDLDGALRDVRESVRLLEPAANEDRPGRLLTYAVALTREGQILGEPGAISLDEPEEGAERLRRSFKIASQLAQRDPNNYQSHYSAFSAETKLAKIVRLTDPQRAVEMYDEGLQHLAMGKDNAGYTRNQAEALTASVYPLLQLGRKEEARKRLDTVFTILRAMKLYPLQQIELGSVTDEALRAQAELERDGGDVQKGGATYKELLERIMAGNPEQATILEAAVELSNVYRAAAAVYRKAGNTDQARALESRRLALWEGWNGTLPDNAFVRRQLDAARLP